MINRNAEFDMNTWYPDIREIIFSYIKEYPSYGREKEKEDILQEVCLGLLRKQSLSSAYDRTKSDPKRYIIMITKNTINNRWKRFKKFNVENSLEEMEELGHLPSIEPDPLFDMKIQLDQFEKWAMTNDPYIVPIYKMLREGHTFTDVSEYFSINIYFLGKKLESAINSFRKTIFPSTIEMVGLF